MAEHTRPDDDQIPEFEGETERDVAHDDSNARESETNAGRKDHSEREWGGDQDIDTAGQVPGEMATDVDDATGF
jgi:hypothetical protein